MKSLFFVNPICSNYNISPSYKDIPEIRNVPYYSLAFGVTSAEVAIVFPRYLQTQVEIQSTWDLRKGTEQFPTATICEGILEILYQVGEPHHN